jgi:hypothetical protein
VRHLYRRATRCPPCLPAGGAAFTGALIGTASDQQGNGKGRVGGEIALEFLEVETGKGADALDRRPQLAAALADHIAVVKLASCACCSARGERARHDRHEDA